MAKQSINIGSAANDRTGDTLRVAGDKVNDNFDELYTALGDGSTLSAIATETYVDTAISNVINAAPSALDTLNELAAALGDDANYSTTVSTALGNRLRVDVDNQGLNSTQQGNALTNLGITSTVAELNILDGVTADFNEINILDGLTASTAELNTLDGITASTAELNILDGVTADATELNVLDGITATTTELNYVDGVTSAIQTQLDAKLGSDPTVNVIKIDDGVHEKFQALADATGVVTHDCSSGHVFYHTSPDADWTANFTNLNLSDTYVTSLTLVIVQGATAYYPSAVQIGGAAQTINWQDNTTPTPNANRVDVVSFSIINNGGTYTVLGQLTGF